MGNQNPNEVFAEKIINHLYVSLEAQTGDEVFTIKATNALENGFEVIVVFANKSIMVGAILWDEEESSDSQLGLRIRGNYI